MLEIITMNAIGYIRVSTEDHAKEGVSLDAQKSKIVAYCTLKDLHLSEIIEDEDYILKGVKSCSLKCESNPK